jgi:hypothetical protein
MTSKNKINVVIVTIIDENGSGCSVVTPVSPTLEYKNSRGTIWELLHLKEGESCTLKVKQETMLRKTFEKLEEIDEL